MPVCFFDQCIEVYNREVMQQAINQAQCELYLLIAIAMIFGMWIGLEIGLRLRGEL